MASVRLEHIVKKFGKTEVIHDISLATREGEFSFLLGPSGAGKTTILSLIAGILPQNEGDIYIKDKLVNNLEPKDRDVAIAFESYALYPNRTVYGNIKFPLDAPLRKKEMTEQQKDERIHEIAKLLQIEELLDRLPRALSGGQRQRIALGRTLVRRPSVYLLDEPIAHLDAKLRHQMRGELKRLQQELGIPIICASPDQAEAVAMADRIFVLNAGTVEQEGSSEELYFTPKNEFVAQIMGEPKMNIFPATIKEENGELYAVSGGMKLLAHGSVTGLIRQKNFIGEIDLGIRPTDVEVKYEKEEGCSEFIIDFFQINGEKIVITAKSGDLEMVSESEYFPGTHVENGQKIWLKWNSKVLYAFDKESKMSLM